MLKKIIKTLFALSIGQIITRLGSLLLIPLFVNYWSTTIYGEWLALSAAIGYLASLDFGISQASTNKMTQAYAIDDLTSFKIIQHSSLTLFITLAICLSIVICILVWTLPIVEWLNIKEITNFQAKITFLLLALYVLWSFPAKIINSTYHAIGRLEKSQWFDNAMKSFYLVIVSALLVLKQSVIMIALVQLMIMLVTTIIMLLDQRRNHSRIFPGLKYLKLKEIKSLIVPGFYFVLYMLAGLFWMQGTIILISGIMGGLFVAMYSVSRTLSLLGKQVVDSFYYALFPDIASLFAKKEYEKLRIIHKLLIYISFSFAILFAGIFWFYGKEIIYSWSIGKIVADETLLRLLLVLVTVQTIYLASGSLLLASNNHKKFTLYYLAANLFGIIISYFLIGKFGIDIVPLSFIAGELMFCYYFVLKDTCQKIQEDILRLIISFIRFSIPLILLIFSLGYLIDHLLLTMDNITRLITGIIVMLILSTSIIWFSFPKIEKRFLLDKVMQLRSSN